MKVLHIAFAIRFEADILDDSLESLGTEFVFAICDQRAVVSQENALRTRSCRREAR